MNQVEQEMIAFWADRLDETDHKARHATEGPWHVDSEAHAESIQDWRGMPVVSGGRWGGEASVFESTNDAIHIAHHDPRTVAQSVSAARRRLTALSNALTAGHDSYDLAAELLPLELLTYTRHPDYKDSWRP